MSVEFIKFETSSSVIYLNLADVSIIKKGKDGQSLRVVSSGKLINIDDPNPRAMTAAQVASEVFGRQTPPQ